MSRIARLLRRLLGAAGVPGRDDPRPRDVSSRSTAGPPDEGDEPIPDIVSLEIGPEIDLHSFSPREVRDVVDTYLHEAHARGLREVRVIHGRGKGVQRNIVRSLLSRHPLVASFHDAHPTSGGWGATMVILREDAGNPPLPRPGTPS